MHFAGIEAANAVNHRPNGTGVSPGMMLFGQKLKLYGELYADGEPSFHHLDGNDAASELGRRLQIRCSSRQAAEAHYAKEMIRKTVSARTRLVEKTEIGQLMVSTESTQVQNHKNNKHFVDVTWDQVSS